MKWLKHIVESGDDPDIDDSITLFGADGYYVFFRTLEVMGREFDINKPGINIFSVEFLRNKYRVSWGKVVKILSFYQEKKRIFHEFLDDNRLPSIMLNCPKLQELSDEYTQKGLKKMSGQSPDPCRDKVTIDKEEDKDIYIPPISPDGGMGRKKRGARPPFTKPTLEEIKAYCSERGNYVDPQTWLDHYTSNGWKVGKNSMVDWKAAVRTWENGRRSTTITEKKKPQRLPTEAEELEELRRTWTP
jgi:hypothetical protein